MLDGRSWVSRGRPGTIDGMAERAVEKFKPTTGILVGYTGLGIVAFGLGYIALNVRTETGLKVALGLLTAGVIVWLTQLRSRATVYPDVLHLKNIAVDTVVPLRLIEDVAVNRTLNVWVDDKRYVCIGIGRSLRSSVTSNRGGEAPMLGVRRLQSYVGQGQQPSSDQYTLAYETFVVQRIEALAAEAKKTQPTAGEPASPRRTVAWLGLVALTVTGAMFWLSLLLL